MSLLQPGQYEIKAEAANLTSATGRVLVVEVGRTTDMDLTMSVAAKSQEVQVSAEAPVINTTFQDFSTNLNQTSINNLPSNGRRWSGFALLTPGATTDGTYGLLSFRGISGLMNNSTVDGGDNNQAFFGEERGRTRTNYVISQESVQEFQVNTSNYSAEYGRAAGAVVNSVTKSGTNHYHGGLFFFDRDNTLGATNNFSTHLVGSPSGCALSSFSAAPGQPICSSYTTSPFKPTDRRLQFGANLGGAIVKDKLFFFFNYDGQRQNIPGIAIPSSPTVFFSPTGPASSALTTICNGVLPCKNAPAAQQTAIATGYYNNAIGFLAATTGDASRNNNQDIFFPKIDWLVNKNNTVTVSYNRMRRMSLADAQTTATVSRAAGDWGDDGVKTDIFNARLSTAINSNMSNEFRFSWGRDFEYESMSSSNPAEAPLLATARTQGIYGNFLPDTWLAPSGGAYDFGLSYFLQRAAYPDERKHQFANTTSWHSGKHLLKFGADVVRTNDLMNNLYEGQGEYYYSGSTALPNWIIDYTNALAGTYSKNYTNLYQYLGTPSVKFTTWDLGMFVQDEFRVNRRPERELWPAV